MTYRSKYLDPDERAAAPVGIQRTVKCLCGKCNTCRHRVYSRIWEKTRKNVPKKAKEVIRPKPELTDAELDAKALKWLEKKK